MENKKIPVFKIIIELIKIIIITTVIYLIVISVIKANTPMSVDELKEYLEEKMKKDEGIDVELKHVGSEPATSCAFDFDAARKGCKTDKNIVTYEFKGINKNNEKQTIIIKYTYGYKNNLRPKDEKIRYEVITR